VDGYHFFFCIFLPEVSLDFFSLLECALEYCLFFDSSFREYPSMRVNGLFSPEVVVVRETPLILAWKAMLLKYCCLSCSPMGN
jgi:hypothetical protein